MHKTAVKGAVHTKGSPHVCHNIVYVEALPRGSAVSGTQGSGTKYWGSVGRASKGRSLTSAEIKEIYGD